MTPYDTAIHALAPYLPDGWVAQDGYDGIVNLFKMKPGMDEWCWSCVDSENEFLLSPLNIPACPDWRTSLRRIQGGKVVEADPTEETKGGGE